MAVATFTKSGNKATTAAKLDKAVFGIKPASHELLKQAYVMYLANGRGNNAKALKRGEVSGGGKKPWKQKGTGRARFGSTRNPIWRGGGAAFGPTGNENYQHKLPLSAKRLALRQALSLAADSGKIIVIETIISQDGKARPVADLLGKIGAKDKTLLVVSQKDALVERATRNLAGIKTVQAMYLNVFDIMNADTIVMDQKALDVVHQWLSSKSVRSVPERSKQS